MGFTRLKVRPNTWVAMFIWYVFAGTFLISCDKNEGMGGTGSISGTVVEYFYNHDYSESLYSSPAVDEEVFILFGDENSPGERVTTGVSGEFMFNFLYPGSYVIYHQTEDSFAFPDDGWESYEVELKRGEDLNLGELVKNTALDFDDGSAVIGGVVKKVKYDNDSKWPNLVVEYIDFAHEHEVYITYGEDEFYSQRVRTQYDGYFEFSNLIPGKYLVFLYSEDVTKVTEHVVLTYEVTISDPQQHTDLGEIIIKAI